MSETRVLTSLWASSRSKYSFLLEKEELISSPLVEAVSYRMESGENYS